MKGFLLLVLVLGAHAQTELQAVDWQLCLRDIEIIAESFIHATIDWMTIIGFQNALIRMGDMLNSMGYLFVHCLNINIPEPFTNILADYNTSVSALPLEISENRVLLAGKDISDEIAKHAFETEIQSIVDSADEDCVASVENWVEVAERAGMAVAEQSESIISDLAQMLQATKIMCDTCL